MPQKKNFNSFDWHISYRQNKFSWYETSLPSVILVGLVVPRRGQNPAYNMFSNKKEYIQSTFVQITKKELYLCIDFSCGVA